MHFRASLRSVSVPTIENSSHISVCRTGLVLLNAPFFCFPNITDKNENPLCCKCQNAEKLMILKTDISSTGRYLKILFQISSSLSYSFIESIIVLMMKFCTKLESKSYPVTSFQEIAHQREKLMRKLHFSFIQVFIYL